MFREFLAKFWSKQTDITKALVRLYHISIGLVMAWFILACVGAFVSGCQQWPEGQGLTMNLANRFLYGVTFDTFNYLIISFPVFFIFLYVSLSLYSMRVLPFSSVKPLLVFVMIQAFNFVVLLQREIGLGGSETARIHLPIVVFVMFVLVSPMLVFRLREANLMPEKLNRLSTMSDKIAEATADRFPHNLCIAVISIIVALQFNLNLNLEEYAASISVGLLFGFSTIMIMLRKETLQRLILYIINPEFYDHAFEELTASAKLEMIRAQSELEEKKGELEFERARTKARSAKARTESRIRMQLVRAGEQYVGKKLGAIENNAKEIAERLDAGEVSMDEFEEEMASIRVQIEDTYREGAEYRANLDD